MVRILVCGDPSGDLQFVVRKVTALCAKSGPFSFILLANSPFRAPPEAHLPDHISFPIPTYFPSQHNYEDLPLSSANLTCVGPAASLSLHGLTVLAVAAGYDDPPSASSPLPPELETALLAAGTRGAGFRGVDVLLAPTLPRGVLLARAPDAPPPSSLVARVALAARPRYHFASALAYTALAPFLTPAAVHATRFFALAAARKGKGERWVYAADVAPLVAMSPAELAATRVAPMLPAPYRFGADPGEAKNATNGTLRKRNGMQEGKGVAKRPRNAGRSQVVQTPRDAKCWFCLANEKDAHLVISIGEHFYVAAAKGGIVPEHLIIIPVNHVRNIFDEVFSPDMYAEINAFKRAIEKFFAEALDGSKAYFFERAVRTRGGEGQAHMHIQCIPIKRSAVAGAVNIAVRTADGLGMQGVEVLEEGEDCYTRLRKLYAAQPQQDKVPSEIFEFFWAELPDGGRMVQLIGSASQKAKDEKQKEEPDVSRETPVDQADSSPPPGENDGGEGVDESKAERGPDEVGNGHSASAREHTVQIRGDGRARHTSRHPLNFGRMVATNVLQVPNRVDWKDCVGVLREEQRAASKLRDLFSEFEPSFGD